MEEYQKDFEIGRGCKFGLFKITSDNGDVYKHLKHESGVHKYIHFI